jgi:hypothetical protein
MQANQAVISCQGRIVSVNGIERKIRGRGKMEDLRPGGFELTAKAVMLGLRGCIAWPWIATLCTSPDAFK